MTHQHVMNHHHSVCLTNIAAETGSEIVNSRPQPLILVTFELPDHQTLWPVYPCAIVEMPESNLPGVASYALKSVGEDLPNNNRTQLKPGISEYPSGHG